MLGRISLLVRATFRRMPRSKRPELTRTKATRSRCAGSMLACTLNTTPVNLGSSGCTSRCSAVRGPGGGACSTSASSTSCTPKLLMAEPKNTGVCLPARNCARSKAGAASLISSISPLACSKAEPKRRPISGLDRPLDEVVVVRAALLAGAEHAHAVAADVEHAAEGLAHAHRPRERHRIHAQVPFDLGQQLERLAHFAVHLVDEGDDGRVARAADLQQPDGLRLHAVGGVDHHERGVHGGQHAIGVFREVLVARGVEQVDDAVAVFHLHHRRGHRDAALLFDFHPVGGRVARGLAGLDAAGDLDRAREQQQLSVSVVLPASGWEMMANVRRRATSC